MFFEFGIVGVGFDVGNFFSVFNIFVFFVSSRFDFFKLVGLVVDGVFGDGVVYSIIVVEVYDGVYWVVDGKFLLVDI